MAEQQEEQKNEVDNQAVNELNEQEAQVVNGGLPNGMAVMVSVSRVMDGASRLHPRNLGASAKAETVATATGTAAAGAVGFFSPVINKL